MEMVKYLVEEHDANVQADDDDSLCEAAVSGHMEMVKYLITKGSNVHADDDAALCGAAECGHMEIVKYLVEEHDANVNAQNGLALCVAAEIGHMEIVKFLIDKGADVHADDERTLKQAACLGAL